MVRIKTQKFLLLKTIALWFGLNAVAQTSTDVKLTKEKFRSQVINTLVQRLTKHHYLSPQLDDAFSGNVWKKFILALDPNRIVFLDSDIKSLLSHRHQIDDQLKQGKTDFFDAAYKIYRERMKTDSALVENFLKIPMRFDGKEKTRVLEKNSFSFPATQSEKELLWKNFLTYHTLKKYVSLLVAGDPSIAGGEVDPATEVKARTEVAKWMRSQFRQAFKSDAEEENFGNFLNTVMKVIDPHSAYSAPRSGTMLDRLSGRYYGLGMELGVGDSEIFVKRMLPGGSAIKSNLVKENDRILSISNDSGRMIRLTDLSAEEVSAMVRGPKGSEVKLELQQPGEDSRFVTLVRGEIINNENKPRSSVIEWHGKKYGLLHLPVFYMDQSGGGANGAAAHVAIELRRLASEGIEGLIFDLRGNVGGSLNEIVRIAGYFLPPGPVSWLRSKEGIQRYATGMPNQIYSGPLVVLVDEASASASEMFAGLIQDSKRGLVVGSASTFGKGTAQSTMNIGKMGDSARGIPELKYGSISVTVQKFYRVTGASTQLKGVVPDIVLQERMNLNTLKEQDLDNTLEHDTVRLDPISPVASAAELMSMDAVRKRAINPTFGVISESMKLLKKMYGQPIPLNITDYLEYAQAVSGLERKIEDLKKLKAGEELTVEYPGIRNIAPHLRKDLPGLNANWMKKVSEDIYIRESVLILDEWNTLKESQKN